MAINSEQLLDIESIAMRFSSTDLVRAFHSQFPQLTLTRCDVGDMGTEKPYRVIPNYNLYLVSASGHCWSLTRELDDATGVVLAAHKKKKN